MLQHTAWRPCKCFAEHSRGGIATANVQAHEPQPISITRSDSQKRNMREKCVERVAGLGVEEIAI